MKFEQPQYSDGIRKGTQTKFAGLNHNVGAGDGELWDMKNLCSDYYPLLATRPKRRKLTTLTKPNGLFSWEKLCWVDGTGFYYDGVLKGTVEDSEKSFCAMNGYIIISPDMAYYNIYQDTFGSLGAKTGALQVSFEDGTIYGTAAAANTLRAQGTDWSQYFQIGDAVEISGCEQATANNGSFIIREIDGEVLRFYENSFTLGTENAVTVERKVPKLDFMIENENRLWGCAESMIYASKLGDPFNFFVYDGLDTDGFAVDAGSSGIFTGAISYLGYPTFFKERNIYKVYGSTPSNFEIMGSATLGLAAGSEKSLAIAGETLFYLNRNGICMYTGGVPATISRSFGTERYRNARAGSDGLKYWVSMQDMDDTWHLFCYDTQRGLWHEEDETRAIGFAWSEGALYMLDDSGDLWLIGTPGTIPEGAEEEDDFDWYAEFSDFTDDSPNKKGVSKLQIRMELEENASCTVKIQMDSDGEWVIPNDGTMEEATKRSYWLAIIPERADHYRLRFEGTGGCRIYSISRDYYIGSESKSLPGRQ